VTLGIDTHLCSRKRRTQSKRLDSLWISRCDFKSDVTAYRQTENVKWGQFECDLWNEIHAIILNCPRKARTERCGTHYELIDIGCRISGTVRLRVQFALRHTVCPHIDANKITKPS
jgi:hypothetical protein